MDVGFPQCFDGYIRRYKHESEVLGCSMHFTVFFPPQATETHTGVPIIFYLSGLTCTDENFIQKAGAQSSAARLGVALIAPDTSPRGLGVPGEDDSYDFGTGAGFYLNATQEPWLKWRMYDYITSELPGILQTLKGLDVDKVGVLRIQSGLTIPIVPICFKLKSIVNSFYCAGVHYGSQHGRSWGPNHCPEEPFHVPVCLGICADLQPMPSTLG